MSTKILLVFLVMFGSLYRTSTDVPQYIIRLYPDKGIEVLNQCSRLTPKNTKSYFYVNDSTLKILKEEFYNIKEVKSSFNSYINDIDKYAYQIIGVVIKNKSYIYINTFPIDNKKPDDVKKYWRKIPVIVCDGGHNYWGVLFDVDNKEFSDIQRNGPGPAFIE